MDSEFDPPWPEWQDQFINDTKWSSGGSFREVSFCDPINHGALPHYFRVAKWRRPFEIYEVASAPWKIGDEHEIYDLVPSNRHLLGSRIMRQIISAMMCLEKVGRQNPTDGKNYYPNTPGTSEWKPWHHIYAVSKIAKGRPSSPRFNPQGMYYVRLFYMGKWRRVTVDDYLPYDEGKNLLLPISQSKCDLWLPILSKALLRIASLTWTKEDDMIDFSVITCLTGWIEYKLDCRYVSIDKIWKAIKLNLFQKPKQPEKSPGFCLTCDTTTCLNNKNDCGCGNYSSKMVFGVLDKTTNEIKDISPAQEHLIYLCYAHKQLISGKEEVPVWKNLRWVNWAIEKNVINAKPGSYLRIIGIFSPFSDVINLRHTREPEPVAALGGHFSDSATGHGNLFDLMLQAQAQVPVSQDNIQTIEDTLEFNFAEIYPYLRELIIYYKCQDFNKSISLTDIETVVDKFSEKPELVVANPPKLPKKSKFGKQLTDLGAVKSQKLVDLESEVGSKSDLLPHETCRFFYLFSDTPFCKNIYFTLSIVHESEMKYGYLICEKYNWKSVAFGPLLLGVRTVGTKTCLLQLGPGVQVCRVFYSLPSKYHLVINSATYFIIVNVDKLHDLLSHYTKPLIIHGDKMLKGFKLLLPITPNTPEHIQLICRYIKTLYPPGYKEFTISLQIKIAQEYEEVFDEAFTKYIFDCSLPMRIKVALLNDLKVIFNNQEFGEPYICKLDKRTRKDIKEFRKELAYGIEPEKMIPKLKILNEFYKEYNMEPLDLPEVVETKGSNMVEHFDSDHILFLNAETHIEVLRNILDKKPQYLQFYPFMNEHYLLLKYKNYTGITEVTPAHNWFIIARLTLNIHSTKAVPCGIYVITEFPKAVLYVIDTDSCEKLSLPPGLSATFHLKRNKIGYTILLCGFAPQDMIAEDLSLAWRIRVLGIDSGNTLHQCESINPYYCQERESFESSLCVQNITGYYLPNTDNIIGRFIISISKSLLATLYLSISNEEVSISLTLKGANEEIIVKAEGKGSVFVPVVLLDLNYGEPSPENEDMRFFFGTIHLLSAWALTSTELAFAKVIRSSSKKDIISLGALYNEIAAEPTDVTGNEGVEVKYDQEKERVSLPKINPSLVSEHSSKEPEIDAHLTPVSSSYSYCGYDSSHTESKDSICISESSSFSRDISIKSSSDTSTPPENVDVSSKETGEKSTESCAMLEKSISSIAEKNGSKKNYVRVVEDPYGLCGAGPHWVLSYIIDGQFEGFSFVDNDYIRFQEFQRLKEQWLKQNAKRLEKGEILRNDFLNDYKNDFLKFQLVKQDGSGTGEGYYSDKWAFWSFLSPSDSYLEVASA
ncbi:unnamed protein product [Nezara viridula]|uniref:Calpain catalytic domain-containing protein n=1 Tax=Nezara viridula TaxID=85310 RepID=A0A9P0MTA8_NEZVI|nr:unnamed protein product [Nezara viridula]